MPYTFLPENPVRGGIQQRYLDKSGAWDYLGSSKGFCFKRHILGIMKSIFKVFIFCLSFFVLGCSKKSNSTNQEFSIICTTFPLYDWVKNIIGENDSVKMIEKLKTVGANTVVISNKEDLLNGVTGISIKNTNSEYTVPFIFAIAVQLIALKLVLAKGIDPDKSNVIAKITVTK